jgi:hypothetical protein
LTTRFREQDRLIDAFLVRRTCMHTLPMTMTPK